MPPKKLSNRLTIKSVRAANEILRLENTARKVKELIEQMQQEVIQEQFREVLENTTRELKELIVFQEERDELIQVVQEPVLQVPHK